MLFMIIEQFRVDAPEIYRRVREGGRSLPAGLRYVDSWVRADLGGCFQLMECDDAALLQAWVAEWEDLAGFEIVPVTMSADTQALMARRDAG
jgi:Domain of unknown function (DUF3303)